jgi:rare lipoprotein A
MRRMLRYLIFLGLFGLVGCMGAGPHFSEVGNAPDQQTGLASYYAHMFHGRPTASGEVYDENKLTAAHRTLPFGTRIRVTNLQNGKAVQLRVTDRGPFVDGRIVDVSWRAANELDFVAAGLVKVRLEVLD